MILACTGHRPNKLNNEYYYDGPMSKFLFREIEAILTEHKPTQCISGMALGADTIFALKALELNIPLLAAIPFLGQESRWLPESIDLYNVILNNPLTSKYIVSDGNYAAWKMHKRNKYMVDNCNKLVAIYDGSEDGGTKSCLDYASSVGKSIIVIKPQILSAT